MIDQATVSPIYRTSFPITLPYPPPHLPYLLLDGGRPERDAVEHGGREDVQAGVDLVAHVPAIID